MLRLLGGAAPRADRLPVYWVAYSLPRPISVTKLVTQGEQIRRLLRANVEIRDSFVRVTLGLALLR